MVEALFRKGWCLQQAGQHADAVKAFDQAINQQIRLSTGVVSAGCQQIGSGLRQRSDSGLQQSTKPNPQQRRCSAGPRL